MQETHTPAPRNVEKQPEPSNCKEVNEWIHFGCRLAFSSALHPLDYSKTLIQLGYEPIPAKLGKSLLGQPIQVLPNVFAYSSYIRKSDGFFGMYRGLTPKLAGTLVSMVFSEKIADGLGFPQPIQTEEINQEQIFTQFKDNLKRDLVIEVSGVVLSHPFQVISVRMMAQFVGKETLYNSFIGSVIEIYRDSGIFGFFSGMIPKLVFEVSCLVLSSSTVYLLNKYLIKDKIARQYNTSITQFAFASVLYPLQVVSTCMMVSGTRLAAGNLPIMSNYNNWRECWNDLQIRDELKRGSSLFFRTAPTHKVQKVSFGGVKFHGKNSVARRGS